MALDELKMPSPTEWVKCPFECRNFAMWQSAIISKKRKTKMNEAEKISELKGVIEKLRERNDKLMNKNDRLRQALRVIHTWVDYKDASGDRSALDPDQIAEKIRQTSEGE